MKKQDFITILKTAEEDRILDSLYFNERLDYFDRDHWDIKNVRYLYISSTKLQYKRNDIVFKEGDVCNNIFIVNKGEFAVYLQYNILKFILLINQFIYLLIN